MTKINYLSIIMALFKIVCVIKQVGYSCIIFSTWQNCPYLGGRVYIEEKMRQHTYGHSPIAAEAIRLGLMTLSFASLSLCKSRALVLPDKLIT